MKKLILSVAMLAMALVGAVPALAQGASTEQYASSGDDRSSERPKESPAMGLVGKITSISGSTVLVEGGLGEEGYFSVTDETEITKREGGEKIPAELEDLEVGQTVEARYAGPVKESYPPQGNAASIAILEDGGGTEEVTATGVIGRLADNPDADHGMTDEATGTYYALTSSTVDLDAYADDGYRVTVRGTLVQTLVATEYPILNVTRAEPAGGSGDEETVTATFELTVECELPEGLEGFSGEIGSAPIAYGALLDGDGVYTTSLPVEQGAEHGVRIDRIDRVDEDVSLPSTLKNFGLVTFDEDETFETSVSFCEDGGGTDDDNGGGSGGGKSSGGGVLSKFLPATGGATLLALGVGTLLVGGGLLARRLLAR